MEYLIGVILAIALAGASSILGLDRERSFYPVVLIVIASYYPLFAVIGSSRSTLEIEIAVGLGFSLLAVFGFRKNLWVVAAAIAGHGVLDLFHQDLIDNQGVPVWWPGFCAAVDIILGSCMAVRILAGRQIHPD